METRTVSLRPARPADMATLVDLLLELYHAELPGAFRGPPAGQRTLVRYLIEGGDADSLRGRYLALDVAGSVVGSVGLRMPGDPDPQRVPPGMLRMMYTLAGYWNATLMLGALLRAAIVPPVLMPPHSAYIHGLVIAPERRGQGFGTALMAAVEERARRQGAAAARLRVIVGNQSARRLYERLGYRLLERTPRWMDWLIFPNELFEKIL